MAAIGANVVVDGDLGSRTKTALDKLIGAGLGNDVNANISDARRARFETTDPKTKVVAKEPDNEQFRRQYFEPTPSHFLDRTRR